MVHGLLVVLKVEEVMATESRAPHIYMGKSTPGAEDRQPVGRKVLATSTTLEDLEKGERETSCEHKPSTRVGGGPFAEFWI